MFLHSGASLHGHEYSSRPTQPAGHAVQRRNPLLRSSFATPRKQIPTYTDSPSPSPTVRPGAALRPRRPVSESSPSPRTTDPVVRFQEPAAETIVPAKSEAMSEDEGSVDVSISDSEVSRAGSSVRRARRRAPRLSTSYMLAQPAPKLGRKQRIIHIRPKLLVQVQQLSAGQRPKPTIDVYPSSAIANSAIAAPVLKRFPMFARIQRELSLKDIMLVKSDDYDAPAQESDSDGDEDNVHKRDIVAILSPLMTGDNAAEIALPDGTVWVATTKTNGSSHFYEFVTVDDLGNTTTARWVRRQCVTRSGPTTPLSADSTVPPPPASSSAVSDTKFTFSIVDPTCRRHPIIATLRSTSLEIQDTYTTVSQSSGRYPPTSPLLASPVTASEEIQTERTTREVEDWQKTFIQISALWVALSQGWVPHFKPTDSTSPGATSTSTFNASTPTRSLSYNAGQEGLKRASTLDTLARRRCPTAFREADSPAQSTLPKRATSTSTAFMQRRRTGQTASTETDGSETEYMKPKTRRAFSSDWSGSILKAQRGSTFPLADTKSPSLHHQGRSEVLETAFTTGPSAGGRRVVSEYFPPNSIAPLVVPDELGPNSQVVELQADPLYHSGGTLENDDADVRGRHHRWRSVTNWFHKLRAH